MCDDRWREKKLKLELENLLAKNLHQKIFKSSDEWVDFFSTVPAGFVTFFALNSSLLDFSLCFDKKNYYN